MGTLKILSYVIVDTTLDRCGKGARDERAPRILQSVLVLGLFVLLAFGVLAFGAVDEWSTFTFEAGAGVLFLVWAGKQFVSRQLEMSKNPLYPPALLFFALVLVQIGLRTSAYGYITKYELLQYVSYGIVLLIAAECVRDEDARKQFAFALIVFGALYAFFAVAQELAPNGKIFWFYTPRFHGSIYGSYVNHDHYAGLMEMLVPIPLVLSMGHLFRGGKRALVASCVVLMAGTIFLSGSRGGMIAFVLEIVLFGALTLMQRRNPRVAIGSGHAVCLGSGLPSFPGQGTSSGSAWRPGPRYPLEYHEGLLANVYSPAGFGMGLGNFSYRLPQLPQLLYESIRERSAQRLCAGTGGDRPVRLRADAVVSDLSVPARTADFPPLGIQMGRGAVSRRFAGMYRNSVS